MPGSARRRSAAYVSIVHHAGTNNKCLSSLFCHNNTASICVQKPCIRPNAPLLLCPHALAHPSAHVVELRELGLGRHLAREQAARDGRERHEADVVCLQWGSTAVSKSRSTETSRLCSIRVFIVGLFLTSVCSPRSRSAYLCGVGADLFPPLALCSATRPHHPHYLVGHSRGEISDWTGCCSSANRERCGRAKRTFP